MRRLRASVTLAAGLALALSATPGVMGGNSTQGGTVTATTGANVDTSSALVQLKGDPLSTYVKTKPAHGKKIDFSNTAVKSYRAQLSALRNDFKQWLQTNAPKARITSSWDLSLNAVSVQLNGTSLATLASAPQAQHVEYQGLYHPTATDPDLALISAPAAWATGGGPANAGEGVKVAIVDTGIDITHPCFSDAGYPAQTQLGDHNFTNNKVIVAKVFNNKTAAHYTAEALQEHGTHVAGTVACNFGTPATIDGVSTYDMSGVAPRALLGNYNIFPGQVTNARSEDILNALDAAYADGMDVANMSLGGGASGIQDLLTIAVDDLDVANMVVAVAAGNSAAGDFVQPHTQAAGHYTIESPGSAARALTAGAASVGHFVGPTFSVGGNTYGVLPGDFATVSADLTATVAIVPGSIGGVFGNGCAALGAGYTGKIAILSRGTCSFSTKIRNAQDAGAVAVIVLNSQFGSPIPMGQDGTANQPTIPAYMAGISDRTALGTTNGLSGTISAAQSYVQNAAWNDYMADFSSQGPTDVDFRVKPDVVAPGVQVLSSIPHQFCAAPPCFAFFQGTSMATPHLAGSAAVLRWLHPDWAAWQIRSAIVNTADQGTIHSVASNAVLTDPNVIGTGRENLDAAANAWVALDPVSVSFGAVPSGSGQTLGYAVTITNLTAGSQTFDLAVGPGSGGVHFSLGQSTITLAAGVSGTFTVWMTADKGAAGGDHSALLTVSGSSGEYAHAVVYAFIK